MPLKQRTEKILPCDLKVVVQFESCINGSSQLAVFRRLARRVYRPALLALGSDEYAEQKRASSALFINSFSLKPRQKPVKTGSEFQWCINPGVNTRSSK